MSQKTYIWQKHLYSGYIKTLTINNKIVKNYLYFKLINFRASLVAQIVKNLPAVLVIQVWSLAQEDPLEKGMATHSSNLAWRIPWAIYSMGSQRVRCNCKTLALPAKVHLVKTMVFLLVMYGCESWTIKKPEHWKTVAFELWCWRPLLRVPWTERMSNQSDLKKISPEYSLEGLMLKLKLHPFATWCKELTHWKIP